MKKRLLCLLLLVCGLLGCSKTPAPVPTPQGVTTEATTQAPTTEATTAPTVETTVETTPPETTVIPTGDAVGFRLDWKSLSLNVMGETFLLYSGDVDVGAVTWSSDDPGIASFDYGIVTAKGSGTTTVYAEYGGVRDSCTVHCVFKSEVPPETEVIPVTDPRAPVLIPPAYQSVNSNFFSDAVFVGDSITEALKYYCQWNGGLGDAQFLARVSYGVYNELYGGFHIIYNGVSTPVEEAIASTGAKKVFIMLGINDIGNSGVDKTLSYWPILLERIQERNPEVQIYIQSIHPVYTGGEYQGVNNKNVTAYNTGLEKIAQQYNCKFIDIHRYMVDASGGMAAEYSADRYVHLSNDGIKTWLKVLYAFAGH